MAQNSNEKDQPTDMFIKRHCTNRSYRFPLCYNLASSGATQRLYPAVLDSLGRHMNRDILRTFHDQLQKDLASRSRATVAIIRISHWLSFTSWNLGLKEYKQLASQQEVINDLPQEYQTMDSDSVTYDAALTEMAVFYGRLGPKYRKKSIELYERLIKYHPKNDNSVWQVRLGSDRRRCLEYRADHLTRDQYTKSITKASQELYSAIANDGAVKAISRAWANLAEIAVLQKKYSLPDSIFPEQINGFSQDDMLEKATSLANETQDGMALYQCGKIYYQLKQYDKALLLLTSALEIRESSKVHHHLALTLKAQMYHENGGARRKTKENRQKTLATIDKRFKQAIKLADTNVTARIGFGRHLKDMGRPQEAIPYINEALHTCQIEMVPQCYEEMSICIKKVAKEKKRKPRRRDEHKARLWLIFALETRSEILLRLKEEAVPCLSVRQLLLGQTDPERTNGNVGSSLQTEMQHLQRLVQGHFEDIRKVSALYRYLQTSTDVSSRDSEVLLSMAELFLKDEDYSSAIILLNLMQRSFVNKNIQRLSLTAHVEGASNALQKDHLRLAHDRFRNSFPWKRMASLTEYSNDETFHVLLLSKTNEKSTALTENIASLLRKQCGLNVAINTEYPVFNLVTQDDLMRRSFCTAIVEDGEKDEDGSFLSIKLDATKIKADHVVIIINVDVTNLQTDLVKLPLTITFPVGETETSDVTREWMRSFFTTALEAYQEC